MPAWGSFFLTVPEPAPTVSDVDSQLSARAVAQEAARPVLGRDALGQFLDGDRLRDGLPLLRRPPAARLGRGNMESRLLGPKPLGAMQRRRTLSACIFSLRRERRFYRWTRN